MDASEEHKLYGNLLKAARLAAGYSSAYAASAVVDMLPKQLQDLEAGRRLPTYPTLHRLVVGLGLDPSALFPPMPGLEPLPARQPAKRGRRPRITSESPGKNPEN